VSSGHIAIDTLGAMLDDGYRFNVWCRGCERGALISVEPFVKKLGRQHHIDVTGHVKCSKCGGKNISLKLQPPSRPAS
jgi:hypothetical protein